jgi:hypothetical protein
MFVRFRRRRTRLLVSLVATRRVDGKPRAEHIASLGSIAQPADVIDRARFWQALHARLAALANRLPDPTPAYAAIQARIPLPTPDEQRAAMLEAAEADAKLWESLRDMHQSTADDHKRLASTGQSTMREKGTPRRRKRQRTPLPQRSGSRGSSAARPSLAALASRSMLSGFSARPG